MRIGEKTNIVLPIFTALAASICCITPVIAVIGGISGLAASFNWLEPYRPYLLSVTALLLGYAWYRHYQKLKDNGSCTNECGNDASQKSNKKLNLNSPKFLTFITVLAVLLAGFPYYGSYLIAKDNPNIVVIESKNIKTETILVGGMTCGSCEKAVETSLIKLKGVISATASTEKGNVVVNYDSTKITQKDLYKAIQDTGYKVLK